MIENEIFGKDQQKYLSAVGMSLFLVKHLRPDNANTTGELLKANNGTNPMAFK